MTKRSDKIQASLERLADRFEYGHLQATTDPAGFLDTVCAEIDRLRAAGQPAPTETAPERFTFDSPRGSRYPPTVVESSPPQPQPGHKRGQGEGGEGEET